MYPIYIYIVETRKFQKNREFPSEALREVIYKHIQHRNKICNVSMVDMHKFRWISPFQKILSVYGLENFESPDNKNKPITYNDETNEKRVVLPMNAFYQAVVKYNSKLDTPHLLIMSVAEWKNEIKHMIKRWYREGRPLFKRVKINDNEDNKNDNNDDDDSKIPYRPMFDMMDDQSTKKIARLSEYAKEIAIPYLYIIHLYTLINYLHILRFEPQQIKFNPSIKKSQPSKPQLNVSEPENTISEQVNIKFIYIYIYIICVSL